MVIQNEHVTMKVVELVSVDCVMILVLLLAMVIGLEQLEVSSNDDVVVNDVVQWEAKVNELEQVEEFLNVGDDVNVAPL